MAGGLGGGECLGWIRRLCICPQCHWGLLLAACQSASDAQPLKTVTISHRFIGNGRP